MKFFCLLFAIGFFSAVRADEAGLDQEEILPPEETLEDLPEFEAFQDIQDGAPEDSENILPRGFTQCSRRGHECYLLTCPRGTMTTGSCNMMYRCCKRK